MSLTSKTNLRRGLALAALALGAACGGGGGDGGNTGCGSTCPPPVETGAVTTTLAVQPSTVLKGDTTYLTASPVVTENGATIGATSITADGQTFQGTSAKVVPRTSGAASTSTAYTRSRGTGMTATDSKQYTVNPLTATITAPSSAVVGQSFNYIANCPPGTDTTTFTVGGNRRVQAGNAGVFNFTPTTTGTLTSSAGCKNNSIEDATTAPDVAVSAAQRTLTVHIQDVDGSTDPGRINIGVNNQTINIPRDTSIAVASGIVRLERIAGQTNIHNVADYKFSDGRSLVLSDSLPSYSMDLGTGNMTATVLVVSKSHPELQGASYASFKRIWPFLIAPDTAQKWNINMYTGGATGGGILGCDQSDPTAAQLSSQRVAIDSLFKYIKPVFNVDTTWSNTKPALFNGTGPGPQNYVQVFCPGDASTFAYVRAGRVLSTLSRDRNAHAGGNFQELMNNWWMIPNWLPGGGEDTQDAGYSMNDQHPKSNFPMALDRMVMSHLSKLAKDAQQYARGIVSF